MENYYDWWGDGGHTLGFDLLATEIAQFNFLFVYIFFSFFSCGAVQWVTPQ